MSIVLRQVKGSALTNAEMDANWTYMESLLNNTLNSFVALEASIPNAIQTEVGAALDLYQLKTTKLTQFINSGDGFLVSNTIGTAVRELQSISPLLTISNANGVDGNPQFALASNVATTNTAQTLTNKTINGINNTLTNISLSSAVVGTLPITRGGTGATDAAGARANLGALVEPTASGIVARISSGQSVGRTITGGSNITITNGSGVSGNPTIALSESPALAGIPTAPTASLGNNSTQIATTAFVTAAIENFAAIKGYIAFNGATGEVLKSSRLSLSKIGSGNYAITCAASIRDGTDKWGVVVGNVDHGILSQSDAQTNAANTLDIWNAFVTTRTTTGFTLRATRKYNIYRVFSAADGDGNATQMFGITSADPTYITLVVF